MAKKKEAAGKKKEMENAEEGPEFMVRIADPKMVRKDLLETLREIIIFMQGYEKFRQIQEEKVATFNNLKKDVKELSFLIDYKLKRLLPKGKLKGLAERHREIKEELEEEEKEFWKEEKPEKAPPKEAKSQLDALESQLREIEGQLRKV